MSWLAALKLRFPAGSAERPIGTRCPLKGLLSMVVVISTVVALAACSGANSGGGNGGSDNQSGSGGGGGVHTVCQILQTGTVATAAVALLKYISHGEWAGGLATDLVISAVQDHCDTLLGKAVTVVQRFFGAKPQQTNVADLANFQNLPSSADDSIAIQLDNLGFQVSGNSVAALVNDLCQDLHGSRSFTPIQDLQAFLPHADLRSLSALNGVTAQVTRTCTPLNNYQADGLVSSIYEYLVSNEQLAAAPLVITSLTWSWVSRGTIDLNWTASYTGVQYYVWESIDGEWQEPGYSTDQTSVEVNELYAGHVYVFAVRAKTYSSFSPWSYMYPCLTCAV